MCARTDVTAGVERHQEQLLARMRRLQDKKDQDLVQDTLAVVTAHHKRLVDNVYARLDQLIQRPSVK